MKGKSFTFLLAIVGLSAGILLGLFLRNRLQPYQFHGFVIDPPEPATDFTLTAHDGRQVSLSDFRGQIVLLYFGYTFCPDACPATLAELARARQALGDDAPVQVLLVTTDPERDTPAALAQYLGHFDPTFLGLTGTPEQLAAVYQPYGIYAAPNRESGQDNDNYLVDHTSSVIVIDPRGQWRMLFPLGLTGAEIAADLRQLLSE